MGTADVAITMATRGSIIMNYEESLHYLQTLPGRAHSDHAGEAGLEGMKRFLTLLGNPQESLKFVHVAGTNGKGSTCAILAAVLGEAGVRVGMYTSPYLVDFRERIQLRGRMISPGAVARLATRMQRREERLRAEGLPLTQFEFVTALAFLWYKEEKAQLVVLEAGLGGRLDATNVIGPPEVAVLCPIGYDHTPLLGTTLGQIAWEKCGILKKGCPVVCASGQSPEAMEVIHRRCGEEGCRLIVADSAHLAVESITLEGTRFSYCKMPLTLSLLGPYQLQNCATALEALATLALAGWTIPPAALEKGVRTAFLPGRMEILSRTPLLILDGAHNPPGTAALLQAMNTLGLRHVTAIVGMLADKDVEVALDTVAPFLRRIITARPPSPRAMEPAHLAKLAERCCPDVTPAQSLPEALAMALADPGDAIVVFGSLYLASALRKLVIPPIRPR